MQISFWPIVLTLVLSLAANLLTPYAEKFLGNISKSIKQKNDNEKRIFENSVKFFLKNPQELVYLRMRSMERSIMGFVCVLFATFFLNPYNIILGIILFIGGNILIWRDMKTSRILREISKRKRVGNLGVYFG